MARITILERFRKHARDPKVKAKTEGCTYTVAGVVKDASPEALSKLCAAAGSEEIKVSAPKVKGAANEFTQTGLFEGKYMAAWVMEAEKALRGGEEEEAEKGSRNGSAAAAPAGK